MTRIDIDPDEFTKLYNEGVAYRELTKKYNCGTTKISSMRVALKLPVRGNVREAKVFAPKHVDEKHFRELYESGYSYQQIGDELGIRTVGTVARYVRIFGLPERDRSLARINQEKFRQMYIDGFSLRRIGKEFRMNQKTTRRVITALGLPERKGITILKVDLPTDKTKPNVTEFKELDDNKVDPDDIDEIDEPVKSDEPGKTNHGKKFFTAPTLRELEKKQQAFDIIKAELDYKNKWRKHDNE